MSLCPEGEQRVTLTDEEFWARVASNLLDELDVEHEEQDVLDAVQEWMKQPCTVCGSTGTCSYDTEGRPMIHIEEHEDDELSE